MSLSPSSPWLTWDQGRRKIAERCGVDPIRAQQELELAQHDGAVKWRRRNRYGPAIIDVERRSLEAWLPALDHAPGSADSNAATAREPAIDPQEPRGDRPLSEHDVNRWLDQRVEDLQVQPWQGQGVMWRAMKDELRGDFARERFNKLRKAVMERHRIKRPRSGPRQENRFG